MGIVGAVGVAGWLVFACQIACKFMLRFSIFSRIFICCIFVFFRAISCGHKILSDRCAAPSVKNANITEIYVIIQSACGIFCCCFFLLVLLSVFCFLLRQQLNKICGRFYLVCAWNILWIFRRFLLPL